jgi:hypothetical protein
MVDNAQKFICEVCSSPIQGVAFRRDDKKLSCAKCFIHGEIQNVLEVVFDVIDRAKPGIKMSTLKTRIKRRLAKNE